MIDRKRVAQAIVNVSEWGDADAVSTHELALADAAIASVLEQLREQGDEWVEVPIVPQSRFQP